MTTDPNGPHRLTVASSGAVCAPMPEERWHFHHGPIDIVLGAHGDPVAIRCAVAAAFERFAPLMGELAAQLPRLRTALQGDAPSAVEGETAARMVGACWPHRAEFITPMAAVAGAVADTLVGCFRLEGIDHAWLNNGGDIALHISPGAEHRVALPGGGVLRIGHDDPVRGLATSGWRGRSQSLGIADAVTVLARDAAAADAAATLIANAVDVDSPAVARRPANRIRPDSDLGARMVTVDVAPLCPLEREHALAAGRRRALAMLEQGLIAHARIALQGDVCVVGGPSAKVPVPLQRVSA